VKAAAQARGIPVVQPERLGSDARWAVGALDADLMVVFAYGRIFGPKFLGLFPRGAINMHPSALPAYRGPAPIFAAILAGEPSTALTVQSVTLEMDAGDILRQTPLAIRSRETTASLTETAAERAAPELTAVVAAMEEGRVAARPQDHSQATYCRLVRREDGRIRWDRSAVEIERRIRACIPWPKARASHGSSPLVLLEATAEPPIGGSAAPPPGTVLGVDTSRGILIQTGEGVLAVTRLQPATRKPMDFRSFLNGTPMEAGTQLGDGT